MEKVKKYNIYWEPAVLEIPFNLITTVTYDVSDVIIVL